MEGDILQNILETQSNKHPEKLNQFAKTFQVKIKKPRTLISPKKNKQTNKKGKRTFFWKFMVTGMKWVACLRTLMSLYICTQRE
jgi:ribosomal protein L23